MIKEIKEFREFEDFNELEEPYRLRLGIKNKNYVICFVLLSACTIFAIMDYKVFAPGRVACEVGLPASKSISNRVLIINALAGGDSAVTNVAKCDDTDAMVNALSQKDATQVNIGAAGTAMRFLTGYYAVQEGRTVVLDGSERMRHRPIKILVDALRSCGAQIEYAGEEGFPPLKISGTKLRATEIAIPGNVSSQYISSLLMISPLIEGMERVKLTGDVISRPYIDMTLSLMAQFGVRTYWEGNDVVLEKGAKYAPLAFVVENDWSAASYWFQIQALLADSDIKLAGLFEESTQGDSALARLFEPLGVNCSWSGESLALSAGGVKENAVLEMDLIENPDLAQTIIVTACVLDQPFHITGLQTLKIKETDRIEALRTQLLKMGYVLNVGEDLSMSWDGTKCAAHDEIRIDTFDDHRMAMAFAPAAVKFPGIIINNAEVVSKSYPEYWAHLKNAGFVLEEVK